MGTCFEAAPAFGAERLVNGRGRKALLLDRSVWTEVNGRALVVLRASFFYDHQGLLGIIFLCKKQSVCLDSFQEFFDGLIAYEFEGLVDDDLWNTGDIVFF